VVLVKLFHSGIEFLALLSPYQQLGDLRTPFHILRSNLSHPPLVIPPLPVQRTKGAIRELPLVFSQGKLGLLMPDLAFIVREVLPTDTDDLREGAVDCFDLSGNVLVLD